MVADIKTFITSDQHLGHANIIKYCNRPFKDVESMNRILIKNWNSVVGPEDIVYFLGDLAFKTAESNLIRGLNGKIHWIQGNHDPALSGKPWGILEHAGIKFLLVHDPDNLPFRWNGWLIHGHHHNNKMDTYPFCNRDKQTINVSVELTGYTPVNLDDITCVINRTLGDSYAKKILKLPGVKA